MAATTRTVATRPAHPPIDPRIEAHRSYKFWCGVVCVSVFAAVAFGIIGISVALARNADWERVHKDQPCPRSRDLTVNYFLMLTLVAIARLAMSKADEARSLAESHSVHVV